MKNLFRLQITLKQQTMLDIIIPVAEVAIGAFMTAFCCMPLLSILLPNVPTDELVLAAAFAAVPIAALMLKLVQISEKLDK